jgi:hypothetical protein
MTKGSIFLITAVIIIPIAAHSAKTAWHDIDILFLLQLG